VVGCSVVTGAGDAAQAVSPKATTNARSTSTRFIKSPLLFILTRTTIVVQSICLKKTSQGLVRTIE